MESVSRITAESPMVGTPIDLLRRLISPSQQIIDPIMPFLHVDLEIVKEQERKVELSGVKIWSDLGQLVFQLNYLDSRPLSSQL